MLNTRKTAFTTLVLAITLATAIMYLVRRRSGALPTQNTPLRLQSAGAVTRQNSTSVDAPAADANFPEARVLESYRVTVPTRADIDSVHSSIGILLEQGGIRDQFSMQELQSISDEIARMVAVNNALKASRAKIETSGETIKISVAPDPEMAVELAKMVQEKIVAVIGPDRTADLYRAVGVPLFDFFHCYGLANETTTITPSATQTGMVDFAYKSVLPREHVKDLPYIFDQKGFGVEVHSIGISRESLFGSLRYGYLRVLLKSGQ